MDTIMDATPYTVMEDFPLSRLIPMIRKLQLEHVVVINSMGGPVGIIPRTALVMADGGHVHSTHLKAMHKLAYGRTATSMRRASLKVNSNMGMTGYEAGELYDDELQAKNNMRKLSRWFSIGGVGDETFVERRNGGDGGGGGGGSDPGLELSTINSDRSAQI